MCTVSKLFFCSISLFSFPSLVPIALYHNYCSFIVSSDIWNGIFPTSCFSLKFPGYLWPFTPPNIVYFRIISFNCMKHLLGSLIGIELTISPLDTTDVFLVLRLPIHDHGISLLSFMILLIFLIHFSKFPYSGLDFFFKWWIFLSLLCYYDLHEQTSTVSFLH